MWSQRRSAPVSPRCPWPARPDLGVLHGHRDAGHDRQDDLRHGAGGEALDGLCLSSPIGRMITPERAAARVPWEQRISCRPLTAFNE